MRLLTYFALLAFAACNSRGDARPQRISAQPLAAPLEIYTYGLPHFDYEQSRQRIARQWGFSYRSIAGCVVSEELLDSANRHNRVVEAALAKRHGEDWKTRFEKETDAAYVLDTLTRGIVFDNPIILATSGSLDSQGKGLLIESQAPGADHNGIKAVAYTYDEWQGRRAYVVLYDLRVDTVARTTSIIRSERRLHQYLD